ncbi:MAG: amidohydrolase [Cryomorphaceae bacterium]|nr:MAG: amidohydrolase [Cryomorphaceae bacterium]|tara:strand:- start:244 stop:1881 length:1638 start_codon:yes stop_codon:yes gene_type:complete
MKYSLKVLITILILNSSFGCKKNVDLIIYNANIYTVDDNFNVAEAVAIKNGLFYDIGENDILKKYNTKESLDLNGSTVLPGLIDAHCHFYGLGLNQQEIDLVGTKSFDEILFKLKSQSVENKTVIKARGWDQNDWDIKEFPNKDQLDVLFPNTPVVLERIDGHAYLVNQKALDMAQISTATKSNNGTLLKKNGKLTGVLIDGPMSLIDNVIPELSKTEKIQALLDAEKICFKNGLTTVDDAGLSKEIILLIDSLQNKKDLKMRIYAMISNSEKNLDYFLNRKPIKTEKLNVRSVKVYGDGALGSRGATLKFPYHDDKKNYGKLVTDPESLKKLASRIADANFQMNTHAIGDSTVKLLLNTYSKVLEKKVDPRWRIEHSQIIDLQDMEGFSNKILPSVQPTHATSDMYWAEDRVGPSRIDGAYSYKALLNESNVIGLGTDFPVEKVNPFHTFYAAVARKDLSGYPDEGFQFQNALSREETLKGMTIWAAYLNFEEGEKGSIEKNKFADFIIVDRDIMKVDIKKAANTTVLKTYLSGELVYSNTKTN